MDIDILFSDKNIAVCVKPSGVDSEHELPRLIGEQLGADQVFCVHRLDRDTGGVTVLALNGRAAAALSQSVSSGKVDKTYLAAASGAAESGSGTMEDLLFHDRGKNKSYTVKRKRSGVKAARLEYERLFSSDGFSLYRIHLITGRTHQIRCQFSSRGMPLFGDRKYGGCPGRLALFAEKLSFSHPVSGEMMSFAAVPPADFPLYHRYLRSSDNV